MKDIKSYWESFCPKQFLNTDPNHPDFARVWQLVKRYTDPNENLILCGASGLCKTRSALYRMKLLLAKHGTLPAVLWADDLDERLEEKFKNGWKAQYKEAQLLLVDDLFTAGASLERYTKYIKGLLDFRLREGRPTIFTTNLQARDIESDSEKFGNATKADQQRVQAIIRRLRGEFRTIDFDAGIGDGRF